MINGVEACDDGNELDGDSCSSDCARAHCTVPLTHATIADIVEDPDCPTIYILRGRYHERIFVSGDRVVVGVGTPRPIIDAGANGPVVSTSAGGNLTLRSLVLTGGRAAVGGGIYSKGSLTLENVDVVRNEAVGPAPAAVLDADSAGGGIFHTGRTLTLRNSRVAENRVTSSSSRREILVGGGIYSKGLLSLQGSVVEKNVLVFSGLADLGSSGLGGGVYCDRGVTVLQGGSVVRSNQIGISNPGNAFGAGAGVLIRTGSLTCSECTIEENRADLVSSEANAGGRGGGIGAMSSTVILARGSQISGNVLTAEAAETADIEGGGLYAANSTIRIEGAEIRDNVVDISQSEGTVANIARGGGLSFLAAGDVVIDGASLDGNAVTASAAVGTARGAAISVRGENATGFLGVSLSETTVDGNGVTGAFAQGGGIAIDVTPGGEVLTVVSRTTVSNNLASGALDENGGGIWMRTEFGLGSTALDVASSTLSGNEAALGGGLMIDNVKGLSTVRLLSSTITDNGGGAGSAGGGLHARGDQASIQAQNTILAGNTAATSPDCLVGGALALSSELNLIGSLEGCPIEGTVVDGPIQLPPLADNGGPTLTHRPEPDSAAVDSGPASCQGLSGPLETDQRGAGHPRPLGVACDVGAVEVQ